MDKLNLSCSQCPHLKFFLFGTLSSFTYCSSFLFSCSSSLFVSSRSPLILVLVLLQLVFRSHPPPFQNPSTTSSSLSSPSSSFQKSSLFFPSAYPPCRPHLVHLPCLLL